METIKVISKEERKALANKFAESIRNWKYDPSWGTPEMKAGYVVDRKDMREANSLFRKRKDAEAWKKISYLDTILRDMVPDDMYYFLGETTFSV